MLVFHSLRKKALRPGAVGGSTIALGRFFFSTFLLLLLIACAPRQAQAQFIGYTSPQTVQQTLATKLQCTGAAQNFTVSNLGQNQHFVTITGVGNTFLSAQIQGIDSQGNVTAISDVLKVPATSPGGALSGTGYYPIVRVVVICSANVPSTFTLSYSGTSGAPAPSVGGFQTAQIDKLSFTGQAANANATDSYQTPFGNSTGSIYFTYSAAPGFSTTLTAVCSGNGLTISTTSFTLANVATVQSFPVLPSACPKLTLNYVTGGATAATFTLEYIFGFPGTASSVVADPCELSSFQKSSAVINAAAASTTQIVAGVTGQKIYVCGFQMSQAVAAGTLQWTSGTGGVCGVATVILTGAMQTIVGQPFTYNGPGSIFSTASGSGICLTTTGAGATAAGVLTYVGSGSASASSAVSNGPFSGTGAGAGWTGPTNTATINQVYATCSIPAAGNCTTDLFVSSLGFAIPAGATITGITVTDVRHCQSDGGCSTDPSNGGYISLTKAADTLTGTAKGSAATWTFADVTETWGGSGDLWGTTWTPADINAAGFGVAIQVFNPVNVARIASVDYLAITVTYTPAP